MTHALSEAFVLLLDSGQVDNDLDLLDSAIHRRLTAHGRTHGMTVGYGFVNGKVQVSPTPSRHLPTGYFSPGDRVRLTTIRPKYLVGQTGVLTRFKMRRWSFKPDNPGAFSRFLDKAGETALTINMFEREMP